VERSRLAARISEVSELNFEALALEVFQFQYSNNPVYRRYCSLLGVAATAVQSVREIPFLPIEVFKTAKVRCGDFEPQHIFRSSGTTGNNCSQHLVREVALYERSFFKTFQLFVGQPQDFALLALLPSYLERSDSSLVYMVSKLMQAGGSPWDKFFLHDHETLHQTLRKLEAQQQKALLIGVSFALLDFSERFPQKLKSTVVMETGGMKGRRQELTRPELHQRLRQAFGVEAIWSEYGMTELFSQAYSRQDGLFKTPPWMKILLREICDPFNTWSYNEYASKPTLFPASGAINVIDLANLDSCSFIATYDLGAFIQPGFFSVAGRLDGSEARGCNLLLASGNENSSIQET
jgi:phenylacetate-coenzyme A ligase PaaK-like adenylate-forming protein